MATVVESGGAWPPPVDLASYELMLRCGRDPLGGCEEDPAAVAVVAEETVIGIASDLHALEAWREAIAAGPAGWRTPRAWEQARKVWATLEPRLTRNIEATLEECAVIWGRDGAEAFRRRANAMLEACQRVQRPAWADLPLFAAVEA